MLLMQSLHTDLIFSYHFRKKIFAHVIFVQFLKLPVSWDSAILILTLIILVLVVVSLMPVLPEMVHLYHFGTICLFLVHGMPFRFLVHFRKSWYILVQFTMSLINTFLYLLTYFL